MAFKQVVCDTLRNDFVVSLKGIEVAISHLSCNFKSNVKKLADVSIIVGVALVMSECADILFAGPAAHFFGARELGMVDIDDGGVRLAKRFFFIKSLGVDFFGEL